MAHSDREQAFIFGFSDAVVAEAGGVSLRALHFDVDAICHAYEEIGRVAGRLKVEAPKPRLAGFCYTPLAALGADVVFPDDGEPAVQPMVTSAEAIDDLREPADYLAAELIQTRLSLAGDLKKRCPGAGEGIGHLIEGPVTMATLLMGQTFFTLPYDDPERAQRLLEFSVKSAAGYARAVSERTGGGIRPGPRGFPDDFAGIFSPDQFPEFVVPYWAKLYCGLEATERSLHSELLRVDHMPFLKELGITNYDPSADQYLTPELLRDHCPARFQLRIQSWHMRDLSVPELQEMYRYLAGFRPRLISFCMKELEDEPKIAGLLEEARQLKAG